jgi:hypothetical protein
VIKFGQFSISTGGHFYLSANKLKAKLAASDIMQTHIFQICVKTQQKN